MTDLLVNFNGGKIRGAVDRALKKSSAPNSYSENNETRIGSDLANMSVVGANTLLERSTMERESTVRNISIEEILGAQQKFVLQRGHIVIALLEAMKKKSSTSGFFEYGVTVNLFHDVMYSIFATYPSSKSIDAAISGTPPANSEISSLNLESNKLRNFLIQSTKVVAELWLKDQDFKSEFEVEFSRYPNLTLHQFVEALHWDYVDHSDIVPT